MDVRYRKFVDQKAFDLNRFLCLIECSGFSQQSGCQILCYHIDYKQEKTSRCFSLIQLFTFLEKKNKCCTLSVKVSTFFLVCCVIVKRVPLKTRSRSVIVTPITDPLQLTAQKKMCKAIALSLKCFDSFLEHGF